MITASILHCCWADCMRMVTSVSFHTRHTQARRHTQEEARLVSLMECICAIREVRGTHSYPNNVVWLPRVIVFPSVSVARHRLKRREGGGGVVV